MSSQAVPQTLQGAHHDVSQGLFAEGVGGLGYEYAADLPVLGGHALSVHEYPVYCEVVADSKGGGDGHGGVQVHFGEGEEGPGREQLEEEGSVGDGEVEGETVVLGVE